MSRNLFLYPLHLQNESDLCAKIFDVFEKYSKFNMKMLFFLNFQEYKQSYILFKAPKFRHQGTIYSVSQQVFIVGRQ